ncbi:hypothetical protein DSOL_5354 [Desulfosporosinus metallidurans]|uniref:Uncharacterized protein n=1 Tax=Desulfosporosinus metallidurans TaxID=1888891 RepID=A0A1Q8QD51_9FIRM|nr:hypothetical protein DSOL_5354 [Desulfosporosinus metallidurans]
MGKGLMGSAVDKESTCGHVGLDKFVYFEGNQFLVVLVVSIRRLVIHHYLL